MITGMTRHARERLQQRAIPPMMVELLERFGSPVRCGKAERLIFDKAATRRLRHYLGGERGLRAVDRWLNVSIIIGDGGRVISTMHQDRRVRRP